MEITRIFLLVKSNLQSRLIPSVNSLSFDKFKQTKFRSNFAGFQKFNVDDGDENGVSPFPGMLLQLYSVERGPTRFETVSFNCTPSGKSRLISRRGVSGVFFKPVGS